MARVSGNYSPQMQEAIRRRATELYQHGGAIEGHDSENWYQAEAEILRESSTHSVRRAVVVNVQGVVYTGEYEPTSAEGYTPGEWKSRRSRPGSPRRRQTLPPPPQRQELQTTIVKRIG